MKPSPTCAEARAASLVRWYPKEWRNRYEDEFTELLASDIAERPRSFARDLNVALGGCTARLAALGLSRVTVVPADQPQRSLATFGCALAIFLTFAVSIWSHLAIAWRAAASVSVATHAALTMMTTAVIICLAATAAGSIPIAWMAIRMAARDPRLKLRKPLLLCLIGITVVIAGGLAFHSGWPVAGRTSWSQQSAGPGGLPGFLWATTLFISAYWTHPAVLLRLPASEVAWMATNPIALFMAGAGAIKTIRRLQLPVGLVRFVAHTAHLATLGVALCLFGTLAWLVDGDTGPAHLFQAGTVDRIGLFIMAVTLIMAMQAIRRSSLPSPPAQNT